LALRRGLCAALIGGRGGEHRSILASKRGGNDQESTFLGRRRRSSASTGTIISLNTKKECLEEKIVSSLDDQRQLTIKNVFRKRANSSERVALRGNEKTARAPKPHRKKGKLRGNEIPPMGGGTRYRAPRKRNVRYSMGIMDLPAEGGVKFTQKKKKKKNRRLCIWGTVQHRSEFMTRPTRGASAGRGKRAGPDQGAES